MRPSDPWTTFSLTLTSRWALVIHRRSNKELPAWSRNRRIRIPSLKIGIQPPTLPFVRPQSPFPHIILLSHCFRVSTNSRHFVNRVPSFFKSHPCMYGVWSNISHLPFTHALTSSPFIPSNGASKSGLQRFLLIQLEMSEVMVLYA